MTNNLEKQGSGVSPEPVFQAPSPEGATTSTAPLNTGAQEE